MTALMCLSLVFLTAAANARQSASVTVSLTVYVHPHPAGEIPQRSASLDDTVVRNQCERLRHDADVSGPSLCEDQAMLYTWQRTEDQAVLLIAPI